jgi:signal transduction histidine kinase
MDAADTASINVHECIESALNIGRNVLKDKIEIIKEFSDIPKVTCTPSQLNQVFLNLFTNSAHAMDEHGKLHIKTWSDAEYVCISVSDNGKGIAAENLSRIFDPFFTTKPIGEGTGLGLSISHQIIQKHGGEIHVDSRVGEGTCFSIKLPVSARMAKHQPTLIDAEV